MNNIRIQTLSIVVQYHHAAATVASHYIRFVRMIDLHVAVNDTPITTTVKILSTSPNTIHDRSNCNEDDVIHALLSASTTTATTTTTSFPVAALLISTSVVGTVMIFTLPFIVMPFVSGQTLPYMATPKRKIIQALTFIQQHQRQRSMIKHTKVRQFLDLGSGDGETVYQALQFMNCSKSSNPPINNNKNDNPTNNDHHLTNVVRDDKDDTSDGSYYYTKCVGIELNTTLYLWSCWRRRMFWSQPERIRSQFLCHNMFQPHTHHHAVHSSIRQSDTIMIFGIPSLMVPLSQLLAQHQCPAGTYILSYRFPLPTTTTTTDHPPVYPNNNDHFLLPARLIYDQEEMRIYECTGK